MLESDLATVLSWRNSDTIRKSMYTDHIITREEHRAWFDRISADTRLRHLIFEYRDRPVGVVNCADIGGQSCLWGFYIGVSDAPRGCGSAMGFFALEHIFEHCGFHRVFGEVFAFNRDSLRFHKRLGFVEDNILPHHAEKDGKYVDVMRLILTAEDWQKIKPTLAHTFFGSEAGICRTL